MLLAALLNHFADQPAEKFRTLAASSAGKCARALAMAQFPERYPPEPMTPRRRARLYAGKAYEGLIQGVIQKELPGTTAGETAFLWPVSVDTETILATVQKIMERRLVGHLLNFFNPNDIARWRAACEEKGMTRLGGIVLDAALSVVYLPALSDGICDLAALPEFAREKYAMATQEFKTISTAGFRNVLRGALDYGYRTQCAIQVDAANLDAHVLMFYRLETSHGIEIIYSRKATKIRATWTLSNGSKIVNEGTNEPQAEWDEVQVESPFDPSLLDQARERIRRVLASTVEALPEREYGPNFTCRKCQGTGARRNKCGFCDGDGIARRSKGSKTGEKPCKRCSYGKVLCKPCGGAGLVQETALPWNCSYCAFRGPCWGDLVTLKPLKAFGERPVFAVKRSEYEASGITYTHPEKP